MFVESFQGQYKDGTNGTHDFRMASAVFLIFRMLMMALYTQKCTRLSADLLLNY